MWDLAFRNIVTVIFDIGSRERYSQLLVCQADKCEVSSRRYLASGLARFSAIRRNIKERSDYWRCNLKSVEIGILSSSGCRLVIGQNEPFDGKRQWEYGYYVSRGRINNRQCTAVAIDDDLADKARLVEWEPLHVQRVVRPADHGITPPHHPDILKQPPPAFGSG